MTSSKVEIIYKQKWQQHYIKMLNEDRDTFKDRNDLNRELKETFMIGKITLKQIYDALTKCKNGRKYNH